MTIAEFLKFAQSHLSDGLVTIVGSGLSSAEGIPGMPLLASHLKGTIPKMASSADAPHWEIISKELDKGRDLESAMAGSKISEELEGQIIRCTAELIGSSETKIVEEIIGKNRELRLSRLLKVIPKVNTGIPFITTNYDRLIEIATEIAGLGVESLFSGSYLASLNPEMSRMNFCKSASKKGSQVRFAYKDRVILLKPHGSLDWFQRGTNPIRCSYSLELPRLMITPGLNKYKNGYNRPFDFHREKANHFIDKASKLLVLGYGFNDDHLETYLKSKITSGTPTLILSRTLSENCKKIVAESPFTYAVENKPGSPDSVSNVHSQKGMETFDKNLWDLGSFLQEAFGV